MTIRRLKTYTGSTGYVYQYYFVGRRPQGAAAAEYIFDVSSDRKTTYSVSVVLPQSELERWTVEHGRSLTEAEQYAVVKMRLFQGFDDLEDMQGVGRRLEVDWNALSAALATLGID
jgi:hypothetical protein